VPRTIGTVILGNDDILAKESRMLPAIRFTRTALPAALGLIGLALVVATPVGAQNGNGNGNGNGQGQGQDQGNGGNGNGQGNGNGNGQGNGNANGQGIVLANTPELDSLVLFGAGALGLAGYALTRARAARRRNG
jgi:hypothetical protein